MSFLNIEEFAARHNMTVEQVQIMCENGNIVGARKTVSGWEIHVNAVIYDEVQRHENEKKEKKKKKKRVRIFVAVVIVVIIILALLCTLPNILFEVGDISFGADRLIHQDIDDEIYEKIDDFEEMYETKSFMAKLIANKRDEVDDFKASIDNQILARADEIEAEIKSLPPCDQISSVEQYDEAWQKASSIRLADSNEFEKRVLQNVENYDDLKTYIEILNKMKITNYKSCTRCGGHSVDTRCGTCSGAGKMIVKWYEHGDWGEVSYTSYTCTKCGGSGKKQNLCPRCGGSGSEKYYTYTFDEKTE